MTFLEATKILRNFDSDEKLFVTMCVSGELSHLELYLRASAAKFGIDVSVDFLPFGTLGQHLLSDAQGSEIFLICPWDLVPETDWRSGIARRVLNVDAALHDAERVMFKIRERSNMLCAYLPAGIPPVSISSRENDRLSAGLTALATESGAYVVPPNYFSLTSYLEVGCPLSGDSLGAVSEKLINLFLRPNVGRFKVLLSDADNTLWDGVVGEDGVEQISADPDGRGYRHFLYQGLLLRLRASGILLGLVSRNDEDLVRSALKKSMPLRENDFVSIKAGYGRKSKYILDIMEELNLGVGSAVFVDDNLVEINEVFSADPTIKCLQFPDNRGDFQAFLEQLASLFDKDQLTNEDINRSEMYKKRQLLNNLRKESPNEFLEKLESKLVIHDRTLGHQARALQLINKTNQFNLNGRRVSSESIASVLKEGGRLLTATLEDRTGDHGEILVCLVDQQEVIRSLVMSCRVFQRKVEHAFLTWLIESRGLEKIHLDYEKTLRNIPILNFLNEVEVEFDEAGCVLTSSVFQRKNPTSSIPVSIVLDPHE